MLSHSRTFLEIFFVLIAVCVVVCTPPFLARAQAPVKEVRIGMETEKGEIEITLDEEHAPAVELVYARLPTASHGLPRYDSDSSHMADNIE